MSGYDYPAAKRLIARYAVPGVFGSLGLLPNHEATPVTHGFTKAGGMYQTCPSDTCWCHEHWPMEETEA